MIKVKRDRDGKIFSSDMSDDNRCSILQIHFCTSYTQVVVQDLDSDEKPADIVCPPIGMSPNWVDCIATQDCDNGKFV